MTAPYRPSDKILIRPATFSHAAELVEQLDVVGIQFALQDEFAVVFPPVEETSVFHFALIGQVTMLLHIGQELGVMLLPVLFSLRNFHLCLVQKEAGCTRVFLCNPPVYPVTAQTQGSARSCLSEVEAHAKLQSHLGTLAEAVEAEVAID